jgi:hypothetical protein
MTDQPKISDEVYEAAKAAVGFWDCADGKDSIVGDIVDHVWPLAYRAAAQEIIDEIRRKADEHERMAQAGGQGELSKAFVRGMRFTAARIRVRMREAADQPGSGVVQPVEERQPNG